MKRLRASLSFGLAGFVLGVLVAPSAEASIPRDVSRPAFSIKAAEDPFAAATQLALPSLTQEMETSEARRFAASQCVALCELAAAIEARPFDRVALVPPNRAEGFTGHYWDKEASLYYAKARYYDPFTARFTQADSFLGKIDDPPSLHRYQYANDNPTMYVDPTGHASKRPQRITTAEGYSVAVPQDGDYTEVHADPIKQIEYELASGQRSRGGAFTAAMDVYQEPTNQLIAVGALPSTLAATLLTGGPVAVGGFVVSGTMSVGRQTLVEKRSLAQVDYTGVQQEGIFGAILGRFGQFGLASRSARVAQGTRLLGYGAGAGAVGSGAGHVLEGVMEGDAGKAFYGTSEMVLGGAGILGLKQMSLSGKAPSSAVPPTPSNMIRTTVGNLRNAELRDAHHIIQDAAVRDLPGYQTQLAPGTHLPGPANVRGTPHHAATRVQRQVGGGTYAAERRIAYKALRKAGLTEVDARLEIERADQYFQSIGVTPQTQTRVPRRHR